MRSQQEYNEQQQTADGSSRDQLMEAADKTKEIPMAKQKQQKPSVDEQLDQLFNDDNYLTVPEVAKMIGRKESTVYSNLQDGKIPGHKMFGQWRIAKTDLLEWGKKQLSA